MPDHGEGVSQSAVLRELDQIRSALKDVDQKVESTGRNLERKFDDLVRQDVTELKIKVGRLQTLEELQKIFVTKEEFGPVKKLVYGCTALLLAAIIGAIVSLVVTGKPLPGVHG